MSLSGIFDNKSLKSPRRQKILGRVKFMRHVIKRTKHWLRVRGWILQKPLDGSTSAGGILGDSKM